MDKCKANAWSTKNEVATMVAGKFAYTKAKGIVPFPCHVYCKRQSLTYAQTLEQLQLLQYSKFQMAKTVVKASFV